MVSTKIRNRDEGKNTSVALRSVHLRRRRCVGDEGNGEKKTQKHAKGEERYARAARIECTHPGATHRFGKKK